MNIAVYHIDFTPEALGDLKALRKAEQVTITDRIEEQLTEEPQTETRNKKPMRPNKLAKWELRIGRFRVFNDVKEGAIVKVKAIAWKEHNRLHFGGGERKL